MTDIIVLLSSCNSLTDRVSKSTLDGVTDPASRDAVPDEAAATAAGRWPVTKVTAGGLNDAARSTVYDEAAREKENIAY